MGEVYFVTGSLTLFKSIYYDQVRSLAMHDLARQSDLCGIRSSLVAYIFQEAVVQLWWPGTAPSSTTDQRN